MHFLQSVERLSFCGGFGGFGALGGKKKSEKKEEKEEVEGEAFGDQFD